LGFLEKKKIAPKTAAAIVAMSTNVNFFFIVCTTSTRSKRGAVVMCFILVSG
jgi:hypothetical protein